MASADVYRLPRHTQPRHYRLMLEPDLVEARFSGRAEIDVVVSESTSRIVLNAADLEVTAARLASSGAPVELVVSIDAGEQQLILDAGQAVQPGEHRLELDFAGVLNDQLRGFYRSTFRTPSGEERVIATTQFEATDARRAFPCFDEPEFKATFDVTLVIGEGLTALSNGPVASTTSRADGRVEVRFATTMPMSTYLVAFVVGPFELTEPLMVEGVELRVAAPPGNLDRSGFALEVAEHALRFLAGYFGIPYPAGKLDHVAIPDFAFGAMENLGCVTYRESLLLADPAVASQMELQRIAAVVAHETAHMWFGDLVTMKWWNGIWLNEAFATFMELTTSDNFRPDWQVWSSFGSGKAAAMETDGLRATRPVEYPVGRPEEAEGMFDVLTYQKGGAVLKMLERYLGPEVFRKGISQYLSTHAYGNTETADLWDALEAASGEPVRAIMDSWIYQGGYPLVRATLDADRATVVLTQERFLYDGSDSNEKWAVPVNLRASIGGAVHHERVLLDGTEGSCTFPGPVDWVVINDGGWGYYRSDYSEQLWRALIDSGALAGLDSQERLQVLGDEWAAVTTGRRSLQRWAEAARVVSQAPDPDVWASLLSSARVLDLIADDSDLEALRAFFGDLAAPVWAALGWEPAAGEGDRVSLARSRLLTAFGELAGDEATVAEARRRFERSDLAPDLVGPAARIVVARGGQEGWQRVLESFRQAADIHEKLRYLYALARTDDRDLLARTLDMSLTSEVRSQDAPFLLAGLVANRAGRAQAWDWVEANWERIVERMPPPLYIRIVEPVTTAMDRAIAEKVHRFAEGEGSRRLAAIRLQQVLESMDVHVGLADRLRGQIRPGLV